MCNSLPEFLTTPSVGTLSSCGFYVAVLCIVAVDIFCHVNMLFYRYGCVRGWFFEECEIGTVTTNSAPIG